MRPRRRTTSARTFKGSRRAETRESGEFRQVTGSSRMRSPASFASHRSSMSYANRSTTILRTIGTSFSRSSSLKPHWVSWNGSRVRARMRRFPAFPIRTRQNGWRTSIREPSSAREPMTTSLAVSRIRSSRRPRSSIGVERSASETSTRLPEAASTPSRTAAPLPRFARKRRDRTRGSPRCASSRSALVPSEEPSSTTTTSPAIPRASSHAPIAVRLFPRRASSL